QKLAAFLGPRAHNVTKSDVRPHAPARADSGDSSCALRAPSTQGSRSRPLRATRIEGPSEGSRSGRRRLCVRAQVCECIRRYFHRESNPRPNRTHGEADRVRILAGADGPATGFSAPATALSTFPVMPTADRIRMELVL